MKLLNNRRELQPAEELAFAERLSAIANRCKVGAEAHSGSEQSARVGAIERRFWSPRDLPKGGNDAAGS